MAPHRGILAYGPEEIHISGGSLVHRNFVDFSPRLWYNVRKSGNQVTKWTIKINARARLPSIRLAYGPEEIHISGGSLVVLVRGSGLELRAMTPEELLITGTVTAVEFMR